MDGAHCTPSPDEENCQSTAFTVTFESAKAANNRFIKRHIRNLSLPVVKVYDNKVSHILINQTIYYIFLFNCLILDYRILLKC